ncbi:MAG TPA: DegT/DnrJ/EryC1/StrS family aminotransferase [Ferruginibacter sp.]|nr:DegT/DnrJ/EryC1/StrS family aminotransferase [Ferruginibacter sp.]HMP19654.1 DegT/DnrJ/EryC1/StrS family aminotransferase [Ferruginibacter sp.]
MIPVTKPFLPPIEEYNKYVKDIWQRNWLTNNGPLVNDLELNLKEYLGVSHLLFTGNGTIAIQIALKALNITGEVITTPFSYVATTSSIVWEGCKPVFADIDPQTLNIDPSKIEAAITKNTQAILATHCFGNPCDVEKIQKIAQQHNLKVIYDAAHCFGTTYKGKSIFEYGDISTTSFHSTKLFHTVEGGAVFTKDKALLRAMALKRNFGHDGTEKFDGVGVNGKNSEFHAAMGLCNLKYINDILAKRKEQCLYYDELLKNLRVQKQQLLDAKGYNYAYYPVVFESEEMLFKSKAELEKKEIYPRRYFYPSLSSLNYVQSVPMPVSDDIAKRILCLPLYSELTKEEQRVIMRLLLRVQNN